MLKCEQTQATQIRLLTTGCRSPARAQKESNRERYGQIKLYRILVSECSSGAHPTSKLSTRQNRDLSLGLFALAMVGLNNMLECGRALWFIRCKWV